MTSDTRGQPGVGVATLLSSLFVVTDKYSLSIYQPSGLNSTTDGPNTEQHINSIIGCKVVGIAHRRLMAFYQGSLEGCGPPPPTARRPLTQSRFGSRAHFPKCSCFKSEMSDISETNNPRSCTFIFTASHLKDGGPAWTEKASLCWASHPQTDALCVLTMKLFKCHTAAPVVHDLRWCSKSKMKNWSC